MLESLLEKFDATENLIFKLEGWSILLRSDQVTLGSLLLVYSKGDAKSLSEVPTAAFSSLPKISRIIEESLGRLLGAEKFNYLALMMIDSQVHFHIVPRYSNSISYLSETYEDLKWPGPPSFETPFRLNLVARRQLTSDLTALSAEILAEDMLRSSQ